MKKLLAEARAAKAMVVYSLIAKTTPADVIKDVAPLADEPHVLSGPDKFLHTDLEKILHDKGIKTVIAVGTSSNGAVLFTAAGAVFRDMKAIVPVDGMSSAERLHRPRDGLHVHRRAAHAARRDADQDRHDQVLNLGCRPRESGDPAPPADGSWRLRLLDARLRGHDSRTRE